LIGNGEISVALLDLWRSNKAAIEGYAVRQIVAMAGDGKLRENSECARELRAYLREVPPQKLADYANECLEEAFDQSGFALQDVVNEVGRRLDFHVENGRYQGTANAIGCDGVWRVEGEGAIVVEVKTTDAYNVRLEKVAEYRTRLSQDGSITNQSSVLFVVGRKDTGALEAQIRGSRYAWDMRVIGIESLVKLMLVREKSSAAATVRQIRELLEPFEYTRLDRIVDVIFDTATDVELTTEAETLEDVEPDSEAEDGQERRQSHTDPQQLETMRARIVDALAKHLKRSLIRRRKTMCETDEGDVRALIATSKRYGRAYQPYWYAFHQAWRDALSAAKNGFLVLGCMDRDEAYAIPLNVVEAFLPKLNSTARRGRPPYWHIVLVDTDGGGLALYSSKEGEQLDLSQFRVPL
jgi:hypothetical protein